ncbi:MAG: 7-cyano-7-deazaguanine synthase [Candidatus Zixiibacteriota bacterium]|nr:MAG: 7-cyano-7-deazaguanine synthase [candidate division Zixibacteria bacterium]
MKRCKRCIMPDTVPGIIFNEEGICNFCLNYKEAEYRGKEELDRLIALIKDRNGRYDCIVPLSGGRDSSFVLYYAKRQYNLKILAVNYDNNFRAEQALVNMNNACNRLNVDFLEVGSGSDVVRKIVRNEIKFVLPRGLFAIAEILCSACAYGYRSAVYKTAEQFKVPLIIWGSSHVESTQDTIMKAYERVHREVIGTRGGSKFRNLLSPSYYKLQFYHLMQRIAMHAPGSSILSEAAPVLANKNIQEISLFDYIPWNRKQIKETITRELGWEKPPDHISSWRTDCHLPPLITYCLTNTVGCSKACFGYCNMINSDQMTREEALRQEEAAASDFTEELRGLLEDKIGLSKKDVAVIRSYRKSTVKS